MPIKVPRRNGQPLGNTEFADMYAAYDALPDDVRTRLAGATILHDFNKFWEEMRSRPGSTRPPLTRSATPAEAAGLASGAAAPSDLRPHRTLCANPGYAIRINGWPERGRADARIPVRSSGSGTFPLRASLDRGRRPDVGQSGSACTTPSQITPPTSIA